MLLVEQKRVVIVYATDYDKLSPGGIRTYIEILAKHKPESVDLTFLGIESSSSQKVNKKKQFIGLKVQPIFGRLNLGFIFKLISYDFSKFDVIICHRAETALFLKLMNRKKVHLFLHGGTLNAFRGNHRIFGIIYPLIELFASIASDSTFAVNLEIINPLIKSLGKVNQAPIVTHTNIFFPGNNLGKDIFLVGRLEYEKQFDLALRLISEAQKRLSNNFSVLVIGEGNLKNLLQHYSLKLGLKTDFYGQLNSKEIAQKMRESGKLLLLTSKFEGMPIVALEALMSGMFVGAIRNPGLGELLTSFGAEVVDNENALVDYIVKVMTDKASFNITPKELKEVIDSNIENYWTIL